MSQESGIVNVNLEDSKEICNKDHVYSIMNGK